MTVAVIETGSNGARRRGMGREIKVAQLLRSEGWSCWTTKNDGLGHEGKKFSHGIVDVVAIAAVRHEPIQLTPHKARIPKPMILIRLIQVKSTASPFASFGPRERRELLAEAERIGGAAELCWWPKHARAPKWIPSSEWPNRRSRAA